MEVQQRRLLEMDKLQMDDPSPKEATKTWGFRRSTIARREFIEEIGNLDLITLMPRRSARQPRGRGSGRGRGKQTIETTLNAPKTTRGGKKSVQANLEAEPDSDVLITTSRQLCLPQKARLDTEMSDQAEDSDELTLRELQERARKRQKLDESGKCVETVNKEGDLSCGDQQSEQHGSSVSERTAAGSALISRHRKLAQGVHLDDEEAQEEQNDADESSNGEEEYSDPDAVYCICQQKHDNRFMIRCDRCHQWFHGDCVGISQSRGRLLEKNDEDYICPSCSPCQSPVDFQKQQPALSKAALSSSSESLFTSSAGEERPSEDEGIKGKIRKSSTHSAKRRIKIFQAVDVAKAVAEPKEQAAVIEPDVAEEAVKEHEDVAEVKDKSAVPKCIGPGCNNEALPESVYCGHQCIIRHASVAMHGHSEPQVQPEIKNKPPPKPTLKIQNLGKLFKKKLVEKPAVEDGSSKETGSTPIASVTPEPVHKAVGEQQPAAISPSQFYKATSTNSEKEAAVTKPNNTPTTTQIETLNPSAPAEAPTHKNIEKPAQSIQPPKKPGANPPPSRARKTMPGSPRLSVTRQLLNETPKVNKSVFPVPKNPSQSQATSNLPQPSNSAPEVQVLPITPAPVPPSRPLQTHPNMQMRQNIRRSLTDTLLKRVNDSDDLEIPESLVERLAINIEREMFNMYYTTDHKYKIKYRSLLLSLKDPKNKSLFYQVVKGHITPFKLTRMSDQELLSVQVNLTNRPTPKEQPSPVCIDLEQPPLVSENKAGKSDSVATTSSVRQAQMKKPSTAVSDIISSMLKDTTSEHKAHLFDLKCRICTGQISSGKDPEAKPPNEDELHNDQEEKPPCAATLSGKTNPPAAFGEDSIITESPASPTTEDFTAEPTVTDFCPPVIPAVSVVTITRRDPRTAGYRFTPTPSVAPAPPSVSAPPICPAPVPDSPKILTTSPIDTKTAVEAKAAEPPPLVLKSILTKPSAPSVPKFYSSPSLSTRLPITRTPADNERSHFRSRQDAIWKGFLNMQLVAKFVTKGCIISGSAEILKKDLPDTIHIGGRILPQTVWEYVERVKTSLTKELSLIRFYPASDEEEVAYVSLFSYFNSRRRFGVISNISNNIKDLYLIPLCANELIPSALLPINGPGLEQNHPNLLIGLAVCQKLKRPGAPTQDTDEKKPRIQIPQDSQLMNLPTKSAVPDVMHDDEPYDPDIAISTTPPDSPPTLRSPDSSTSFNPPSTTSLLSSIHAVITPPVSTHVDVAKMTSSSVPPLCGTSSTMTTPLQTILNTIFGKKKQDHAFARNTTEATPAVSTPTVDPIVQQYRQTPKAAVEMDDNDRPYDPEEEYDPALGYEFVTPIKPVDMSKSKVLPTVTKDVDIKMVDNDNDGDNDRPYDPEEEYNLKNKLDSIHANNPIKHFNTKPSLQTSAIKEDIAYDPEDETVFEEMQNYLSDDKSIISNTGKSSVMSLSEQQKMLEDLNRQIEEQKRQLEEQEEALRLQRAAVGVSMAHFSVSDALMSPPPSFGRESDQEMEKAPAASAINLNKDPRQYRHVKENIVNTSEMGPLDNENVHEQRQDCQSKFLENNPPEQALSKNVEDVSLGDLDDTRSITLGTTVLHPVRNSDKTSHLSVSELQEGTSSSSGNDKIQRYHSPSKDSGRNRQSRTSRRQHHSSPQRQSRHETRKPYLEKGSSDQSKDDGHHRSGRRSSERSSRRSRSRSRRQDRASSREKDWHRYRSTSSRCSSRRDRQYSSSRAHSSRSRTSPEVENNQSNQKEKSASRHKNEPNTRLTDDTNNVASTQPQSESSGTGEQKVTKTQKDDITKSETDKLSNREQPSSELPCGITSQSKQDQLELNEVKTNPLHREGSHNKKTQSELSNRIDTELSTHQDRTDASCNIRHEHSSQRGNVLHNNKSHGNDEQSLCQESDRLFQKTLKVERDDSPTSNKAYSRNPRKVFPQKPQYLRENEPSQRGKTSQPRDFAPQGAHTTTNIDLPQLENDIQRNIQPRDQFRQKAYEVHWRRPQNRMDGPRFQTPAQPRIPRSPHPEQFERCQPAGPRFSRPKLFDDFGKSKDIGPRGPTSGPRVFEDPDPRSFRPRCPNLVSRMFDRSSSQSSGVKEQFPRPGMFEGAKPQNFGPSDSFTGPDMFDGPDDFAGSPQRELDHRDPHLQDIDDSWGYDVPHQVDKEPFMEFKSLRGHGPPQQFHENMLESEQSNFNDARYYDHSFDEAEIGHPPRRYLKDRRDYVQNFGDERGPRNLTPRPVRTQSPPHAKNPSHNYAEGSQFPGIEMTMKRSHHFDDSEIETVESHFTKPNIFESFRGSERAAQMKGPRLNLPQNSKGPRVRSSHFRDQRMPPNRNPELSDEKTCSRRFELPSTSKAPRPQVNKANDFQNLIQSRMRTEDLNKEIDIRPLRRSGPLLPTPPGGPIRFHNPRK